MNAVDWVSYAIVCVFQLGLFLRGFDWITNFLNWAGPLVYLVMIALLGVIWYKAGGGLVTELGNIFDGRGEHPGGPVAAFAAVVGTMVAYFAAVVINYGDFSRFVKNESQMKWGNFLGLPVSLAFFSFLALFITAGTAVLFGEIVTNPAEMVAKVDNLALTIIAALTFFAATVGINLVANFIPAAFGLANLAPARISARTGGIITAVISFFIGGLWVALISHIGIAGFVDTLGAVLAPLYGILRDALRQGHAGPIRLFHGSRSADGLYLTGELGELARAHTHLDYVPCVSGPDVPARHAAGRVHDVALTDTPDLKGWRVFLCGHPDMVQQAQMRAYLAGASLTDIHADAFTVDTSPDHQVNPA